MTVKRSRRWISRIGFWRSALILSATFSGTTRKFCTRQLDARNALRETNAWAAMGYRSRRLVINTNLLKGMPAPRSVGELTNQIWRGKVALAYLLFGTTATHFLALRQHWGEEKWQAGAAV